MSRRKNAPDDDRQEQIDFTRGDQLGLLDDVPIPQSMRVPEGNGYAGVSGATIRSVLRAIDSHCRGGRASYPSASTIGKNIGRNEKTVRRALDALELLQFVIVEPRDGRTSLLRINWGELSLQTLPQKVDPPKVTPDMLDGTPDMLDGTPDMLDGTPDMVDGTPDMVTDEAYRSVEEAYVNGPEARSEFRTKDFIQAGEIQERVARLFDQLHYRGNQGQTLWLTVAAIHAGKIPEDALGFAVDAVKAMHPRKPVGYFRRCLADRLGVSLGELSQLLGGVRIRPRCPASRPNIHREAPATKTVQHTGPGEINDRRNEILRQLNSMQDTKQ